MSIDSLAVGSVLKCIYSMDDDFMPGRTYPIEQTKEDPESGKLIYIVLSENDYEYELTPHGNELHMIAFGEVYSRFVEADEESKNKPQENTMSNEETAKMAVEFKLQKMILSRFVDSLELDPKVILEGVRDAGHDVARKIISEHSEYAGDETFRQLVTGACTEVTAELICDRMSLDELKSMTIQSLQESGIK